MQRIRTQASRDLAIAIIVIGISSAFLISLNVNERFIALAAKHERWQLDEFPAVLLVIYIMLTWYSIRRWTEARQEITARLEAEQKISQLLAENQRLFMHAIEVQEDEKRKLARDLHDEMGQYLHAARTESVALRLSTSEALVKERATSIEQSISHIQLSTREMIGRLRPPALDALGLSAALAQLVHQQCSTKNIQANMNIASEIDHLNTIVAMNVYRIVQECLTNIVRHANASQVRLTAKIEAANLNLEITDNGVGYPSNQKSGFGLIGIRERIEGLGGKLNINSQPKQGVAIKVTLPISTLQT